MSNIATKKGLFKVVLNAHLPYSPPHDDHEISFQERWLYRAILESYLPFLECFNQLKKDSIPFKVTLVLSTPLVQMLVNSAVKERFSSYLRRQLKLAEDELVRTKYHPTLHKTALLYHQKHIVAISQYDDYKGNIIQGFVDLVSSGHCELIATAATFSYLPLYQSYEHAVRAQVKTAVDEFKNTFGYDPHGFWLPHGGYYPGLDEVLKDYNIDYFYTASHALLDAKESVLSAIYEPVEVVGSGCIAFARDRLSVSKITDLKNGYTTNSHYREYYHDIGYELPDDYMSSYRAEGGYSKSTGFKYMAVTGNIGKKSYYDAERAMEQVGQDVDDFVSHLMQTWEESSNYMEKVPLIVSTYDMEFFGQWWFEGVIFIDRLFRKLADYKDVQMITASDYLSRFCHFQQMQPSLSSWGEVDASNQLWLDESNSWLLKHIFRAIDAMIEIARRFPDASGLKKRILNQAAREILLLMASDWPLMLRNGSNEAFVSDQIGGNLENFYKIYDAMSRNTVQTSWLTALEQEDHIFSESINYLIFL